MKSKVLYIFPFAIALSIFGAALSACDDSDVATSSCVDDECPGDPCLANERTCSADQKGYMLCSASQNSERGTWSEVFLCSDGTTCQSGECGIPSQKCTATAPECTADNKGYRVCVQGVWSEPVLCTGSTTCKSGQCVGDDVTTKLPCKTPGEQRCVSKSRIQVCGQDLYWQFMDCPADVPVCDSDTNECVPANCSNNEIKCVDDETLATCVGNNWTYSTCPTDKPKCLVNQCTELTKECVPSKKKCISEKQAAICNQAGFWEDGDFCSGSSVCYQGECAEKCSPGEKKCVTDKLAYVCSVSGYWESVTCSGSQVCSDGQCQACKEGETRCADTQSVETCIDGKWKKTSCKYGYCSKETDACIEPGDKCTDVYSYCLDNTLVWCSGSTLNTLNCYVCLEAKSGLGATCRYANLSHTASGITCESEIGKTKQGQFVYDGSNNPKSANCLMCQSVDDKYNPQLWVPVNQTYCEKTW